MSHNLKLKEAISWRLTGMGPFNNAAVFDGAKRLRSNLERVRWIATLLPWLVGKATLYQDAATRVELSASQAELSDPEFVSKAQGRIHAIADADEALSTADDAVGFAKDAQALNTIKFLLGCYGHPKSDGSRNELLIGFDALFQSMLIGAWTAIEITLEDLFTTAGKILDGKHLEKKIPPEEYQIWFNPYEAKRLNRRTESDVGVANTKASGQSSLPGWLTVVGSMMIRQILIAPCPLSISTLWH